LHATQPFHLLFYVLIYYTLEEWIKELIRPYLKQGEQGGGSHASNNAKPQIIIFQLKNSITPLYRLILSNIRAVSSLRLFTKRLIKYAPNPHEK
jgi:hypothetical protein